MMTKTTMVVIFNLQNSQLLTLSLPTEEVFQVNRQNRPRFFHVCCFGFSQGRKSLYNTAVYVIKREQYMGARRYGISLPVFNSIAHE